MPAYVTTVLQLQLEFNHHRCWCNKQIEVVSSQARHGKGASRTAALWFCEGHSKAACEANGDRDRGGRASYIRA